MKKNDVIVVLVLTHETTSMHGVSISHVLCLKFLGWKWNPKRTCHGPRFWPASACCCTIQWHTFPCSMESSAPLSSRLAHPETEKKKVFVGHPLTPDNHLRTCTFPRDWPSKHLCHCRWSCRSTSADYGYAAI